MNSSTSLKVQYAYADGSQNTIRPTSMTYPNGWILTYSRGPSGGINDAANCVASLIDDDCGSTHLAPLQAAVRAAGADLADDGVVMRAEAVVSARTGIEMEALTAVSVALLTVYDMCKAVDKAMVIGPIRLVEKTKEALP